MCGAMMSCSDSRVMSSWSCRRPVPGGESVQTLAERILLDLAEPFEVQGTPVSIGASIGVAVATAESTAATLLHEADLAMYRAKQSGRNQWKRFDRDLALATSDRLKLSTELRGAVERGELALLYQPIVDMADLRVVSYEALLRWNRPNHGQLSPESFIADAEESRDIVDIGKWVVAEAIGAFAAWRTAGLDPNVTMAVNVAAQQLADESFIEEALDVMAYSGVPADRVTLELTEHTLVDVNTATAGLLRARAAGLSVALDDFGSGYSSLTQLEGLPVDVVKVDRQFVARLADHDRRHTNFLAALVSLLASLELRIIVEGVETEQERAALLRVGFRLGQGFLFGRPVSGPLRPDGATVPH